MILGHAIIMLLFTLGIAMVFLIALVICIVVLCVKNLKNQASKKVAACIIAIFMFGTVHALFIISHRTDLRYNDWLIVGHNIEFVEKIYGPAERRSGCASYEIGYYDYWMELDPDGTVVNVYYGVGPGG